jgi:hypothetical protein
MDMVRERGSYHIVYSTQAPVSYQKAETRLIQPRISYSGKFLFIKKNNISNLISKLNTISASSNVHKTISTQTTKIPSVSNQRACKIF